ncbi:MAG: SDR family NAD(P)-dependent oxidoreductase [Bacteroidota bacterium]
MSEGRFKNPVEAVLTGIKDLFRQQKLASKLDDNNRMDGKTCLITGANSGLGYAISVQMAKRGAKVIMACRSGIPEKGEMVKKDSGSEKVEMIKLDLTDLDSINQFCNKLKAKGVKLDVIIANAGVAPPKARKTPQGFEEMFMVNYLSKFVWIRKLLENGVIPNSTYSNSRKAGGPVSRIIFISSDSHQTSSAIDYDEFGVYSDYGVNKSISNYSYYKLVMNTFSAELSKRLKGGEAGIDVSVNAMCPGPVNTNIARDAPPALLAFLKLIFKVFFQSPEKAAKPVTYMACSPDFEGRTNVYLHMFNEKPMDEKVYDGAEGEKLWKESKKLINSVQPGNLS